MPDEKMHSHVWGHGDRLALLLHGQQDLGFSAAQVALRAGHDPAVAGRFYTGNVAEADRRLALAVSELLSIPEKLD